ncbi:MAG: hypothetical protein ACRD8O_05650, partial [Bryobacteraceae bacterium]
MRKLIERAMHTWEDRLANRATDRIVRPFEWGLEWTGKWPCAERMPRNGHSPLEYLRVLSEAAVAESAEFFSYRPPRDFVLEGGQLRFASPSPTQYPENNT